MPLVEALEPAVGALPAQRRLSRLGPRLDPADAADQAVKRGLVVERRSELDPGGRRQEGRQPAQLGGLGRRQQDGDDAERLEPPARAADGLASRAG